MPKVSVIIPTYNRSHFVCNAVDSVLSQNFSDFEVIVVDDGSTDNTKQVLCKYGSRIQYIYQENKGRSEARNSGIRRAGGEYIAFLDDDDIWLPQKLEKQVAFLDVNPDIGLVHAFPKAIDTQGSLLQKETKRWLRLYRKAIKIGYTYEGMSRLCVMLLSSVMVRRDCFGKVGLFDPSIPAFEDWDFYLRLALKYRIGIIREPLVKYRTHQMHTRNYEFIQGQIKVSEKHLAMADPGYAKALRNRIYHNFYMRLSEAYYIGEQPSMFRHYLLKALELNPPILFHPRVILHFLQSLNHSRKARKNVYPERINPEEAFGGPIATHLKRYDFVKQFCAGKIVLDAACGAGYGSQFLAESAKEVLGVDISTDAIGYAREHYEGKNIRFEVMDVQNLELPDKYFEVVCSFETMEHLDNPERFISEVRRALKDTGVFVVSTPHSKKTTYNPPNPYHKMEFSHQAFETLLSKYFVNVEIFGQRRKQSLFHYYLQKIDIFHLRAMLPAFVRRKICLTTATSPWEESDLKDFVISKEKISRSDDLIGVCRAPRVE